MHFESKLQSKESGFVTILLALSFLMTISYAAFYFADSTLLQTRSNKSDKYRFEDKQIIKHFMQVADCCQMLAPYAGQTCADINADGYSHGYVDVSGQARTLIALDRDGRFVFDDWRTTTPENRHPGFGFGGANVDIRCEAGGSPAVDALTIYIYRNIEDPLTGKSLAVPKEYLENQNKLCLCRRVMANYSGLCGTGVDLDPLAYGERLCPSP